MTSVLDDPDFVRDMANRMHRKVREEQNPKAYQLGRLILVLREKNKLHRRELAEQAQVDIGQLFLLERELVEFHELREEFVSKIAGVLNTSISLLMACSGIEYFDKSAPETTESATE